MKEYKINNYEAVRESDKIALNTFTFDLYNPFESIADKEITSLINEINRLEKENEDIKQKTEKIEYEGEIIEIGCNNIHILEKIENAEEKAWALIEMKIIYAYKFLEINTKRLIRFAFPESKTNNFYKWDILMTFLKSKNLKPDSISCFQDIVQLKDVNNSLKHSNMFNDDIKKNIPEFRNKNRISFNDLNKFYSRVKNAPYNYIEELVDAIYNEIYEFEEQKIDSIASGIAYRMGKEDAVQLIKSIRSKY